MATSTGKQIRMGRILNPRSGRVFLLAMDHGFSEGPLPGLRDPGARLADIGADCIDAVIVHRGMVHRLLPQLSVGRHLGLIVHLSGATSLSLDKNDKRLVCSVEGALRLGADAVSIHVNFGARTESQMISDLGAVSEQCQLWGMPLVGMLYPRGDGIADPYSERHIAHVARVGVEMGVDIVKTYYTGDVASFARAIEGVDAPVVVAGGPKLASDRDVLQMAADALEAGAAGVCFGRNVFQSPRADKLAEAIENIVHKGFTVAAAMEALEGSLAEGAA